MLLADSSGRRGEGTNHAGPPRPGCVGAGRGWKAQQRSEGGGSEPTLPRQCGRGGRRHSSWRRPGKKGIPRALAPCLSGGGGGETGQAVGLAGLHRLQRRDRRQPRPAPARPRARSRPHLEEELHVRTAEVVGPVQLPQDVHGQRDVVQHLLDLALQTLQHLLGAQVGPRLGQTEDVPKSGRASWAGPRAPSAGGRAGWGPAAVARRVPLGFTPQPVCRALRGFQETELLPSPGPSAPAQAAQACWCGTRRPRKPQPSLARWDSPPSNTGLGGLALPRSWENSG